MIGVIIVIAFIAFLIIGFWVFTLYNAWTWRTAYPQCIQQYKECPIYDGLNEEEIKTFLQDFNCRGNCEIEHIKAVNSYKAKIGK